jgi:hypothetical protein
MSSLPKDDSPTLVLLNQIQKTLQTIQQDYRGLSAAVERIDGRVIVLSGIRELQTQERQPVYNTAKVQDVGLRVAGDSSHDNATETQHSENGDDNRSEQGSTVLQPRRSTSSRIILTTYPGQAGIDPLPMSWGHKDHLQRGPVVVSRNQSTFKRRNGMLFSK